MRYVIFYASGAIYATTEWIEVAEAEAIRLNGSYLQCSDL